MIPPDVYPGRFGLLITTLLMMINMFMGVMHSTPNSGGINQIQVWLLSCIFFVFASGTIYFVILLQMELSKYFPICKHPGRRPKLDNICLILAPVTFIIFIILYISVISNLEIKPPEFVSE